MQNFNVHLYTQVRVKVVGIKAAAMEDAIDLAEKSVDFESLLGQPALHEAPLLVENGLSVTDVEWTDAPPDFYLVDVLDADGEAIEDEAHYLGPDCMPLVDGKTSTELMAVRAELAMGLLKEVLHAHGTLGNLGDATLPGTREDLLYLQQAILADTKIDHYPDESSVLEVVSVLPRGKLWATYIRAE